MRLWLRGWLRLWTCGRVRLRWRGFAPGLGRLDLTLLVNLVRAWRHLRRSCRERFGWAASEVKVFARSFDVLITPSPAVSRWLLLHPSRSCMLSYLPNFTTSLYPIMTVYLSMLVFFNKLHVIEARSPLNALVKKLVLLLLNTRKTGQRTQRQQVENDFDSSVQQLDILLSPLSISCESLQYFSPSSILALICVGTFPRLHQGHIHPSL
jgi:hypothetical protein